MGGVLAERLRQARARFDAALEVQDQAREARVAVAARDDFERLQQRHARAQHRRELPGEERHVLVGDPLAATERLTLDLGDADALPAQVGRNDGFRGAPRLAARLAIGAVDALPKERVFPDPDISARGGGGGHGLNLVIGERAVTRW